MEEKVLTFTVEASGGSVTGTDIVPLMEMLFGNDKKWLEDSFGYLEGEESEVITIRIEKKFTQKELDEMPESDGDIF